MLAKQVSAVHKYQSWC